MGQKRYSMVIGPAGIRRTATPSRPFVADSLAGMTLDVLDLLDELDRYRSLAAFDVSAWDHRP